EEVRTVFGRRSCRIIGKRFRLAHVMVRGELFEVSTFRRKPKSLADDNEFGTARDDIARRDFTVNALFYSPSEGKVIDLDGRGISDIRNGVVRAIGDPDTRFKEDPVRMLRALKLVALFDFKLEDATGNALFANLALLEKVPAARLSLEVEKILLSSSCDVILETMHDYGLLKHLLPRLDRAWDRKETGYALDLLAERGRRIEEGWYRASVSIALAATCLPYVEAKLMRRGGTLYESGEETENAISSVIDTLLNPLSLVGRIKDATVSILATMPLLRDANPEDFRELTRRHAYPHARELMIIRGVVAGEDGQELGSRLPCAVERRFPRKPRR
ncbi:MAG: hypothetical protein MJ025_04770, partial [Victivallaceae bacterium]|nr:hypothetical protein [Victivallaceae bacterium]